jgi:N-acetylglucosaminyl-diphospho-decaprenol L-rhamnosyltransferase
MTLTVDVVVVAFGDWDLTRSCLDHLARQSREHRVVVVDNGSGDTVPRIEAAYPDVEAFVVPAGPYGAACNRGVDRCRGDVVVMLNNDVDAREDFLEQLVRPLEADARVGSVSSRLVAPGEQRIDSVGLVADPTLAAFPRWGGAAPAAAREDLPPVAGPSCAAAAFRRRAWDEVGGLDEAIFAYNEDFDLALRLRNAGWRAAIALDAVAVHIGSASFGHRSAFQRHNGGFGRGYVLRRYGVLRSRAALRAILTEAIVVAGDAAISRDLEAMRGRWAGWRAARGMPRHPWPPDDAIDHSIGFRQSLRLRRGVYSGNEAAS